MQKNALHSEDARRPVVRVKPRSYQPTRAEMGEVVKIDATPEGAVRRIFRQIRVIEDPDA